MVGGFGDTNGLVQILDTPVARSPTRRVISVEDGGEDKGGRENENVVSGDM